MKFLRSTASLSCISVFCATEELKGWNLRMGNKTLIRLELKRNTDKDIGKGN